VTASQRTWSVLGGAGAGLVGGLFGVGGGVMLVPVIAGPLGRTQHEAHGTSLTVIGATALAGILVYGFHGRIDWATALIAGPSSMIAARAGAAIASRTSTRRLRLGFALLLVVVAIRLLWKTHVGQSPIANPDLLVRVPVDIAVGAAMGLLAGLMGVGGGVIAVLAFTLLLGMAQQRAQGTSLALILLAAPAGALAHARHGNVVPRIAGWVAMGSVIGAVVASQLVQAAPGPLLTRAFAVFLLVNAAFMLRRAISPTPSGPSR
jgi:uncharacterized membrane protein YfcA